MADGDIGILYSKVNKIDERVTALESTRPYLEKLIERNIDSNEKLSDALRDMQGFMQSMNTKIDMQSNQITEIKDDFNKANEQMNAKITEVDNKIAKVEEKSKFDIVVYIKQNWPVITLIVAGAVAYFSRLGIL